jgi:hypothetical protein
VVRAAPEVVVEAVAVVLGQEDLAADQAQMVVEAVVVRTLGTHHLVEVELAEQTQPDQELVIQDLVLGLVTLEMPTIYQVKVIQEILD